MIFGLLGAKATAPVLKVGWESVTGIQLVPASRLSQTPPPADPSSQWFASPGSAAKDVIRPVGPLFPAIGPGPMLVHTCASPNWPNKKKINPSSAPMRYSVNLRNRRIDDPPD